MSGVGDWLYANTIGELKSAPGQLKRGYNDVVSATQPGAIEKDVKENTVGEGEKIWDEANKWGGVFSGGGGGGSDKYQEPSWISDPKQIEQMTKTANDKGDQEQLPEEITKALAPEEAELSALPSEYSSAISQINALPGGASGPNAELNQAVNKTTAALEQGEGGVEKALGAEAPAVSKLEADLPYADVLSTLLTQKKNEILYGESSPVQPGISDSNWSKSLQQVYQYINGDLSGSTALSGGTDTIPSIVKAAGTNTNNQGAPTQGNPNNGIT